MWFNNALTFQYKLDENTNLNEALESDHLKPCPPHARSIYGWMPVQNDTFAYEVSNMTLICLGKEERILPKAVINKILDERLQEIESKENRKATRSERSHLAEELEFELLPKAFCVQKKLWGFLDKRSKRLIVNTASANAASQFTASLRKSIPGISIEPLEYDNNLAHRFSEWIKNPQSLANNFDLSADCQLYSPDDEKKRFNCKGYELPAAEILDLLAKGLAPAEISLIWHERIQFSLNQDFTIKRIKCLDYLVDEIAATNEHEEESLQFDAKLTILSGELRSMVNDLLKAISVQSNVVKEEATPV